MAKRYELSIKATYLSWGRYEAIRELVQNARDAEIQDGAEFRFEHIYRIRNGKKVGCLIIENKGTTIPRQALLIGHTTKLNDNRTAGLFGEGLKLGCLAGIRNGFDIKIRNGSEVWIPVITWSETYHERVLAFDVSTGHKDQNRVMVEILGIEADEWEEMKHKFLFLNSTIDLGMVETVSGQVFLAPDYVGKIYVKGLYVGQRSGLSFGYNLFDADIDRDRRMVSDTYHYTSKILAEALNSGQLTDKIMDLLSQNDNEVNNIYASNINEAARNALAKKFGETYPDAVPVETREQIAELSHYGVKGVEVPYNLHSILSDVMDTGTNALKKLRFSSKYQYALNELTDIEHENFQRAVSVVSSAMFSCGMTPITEDRVIVVDFNNDSLHGIFHSSDNSIRLARKILDNFPATLRTLIHESAHVAGRDGTKSHEAAIGNITEAIFKIVEGVLRNQK